MHAPASLTGTLGVIGLRVPGDVAYRHLAIRLVSTACKMALERVGGDSDREFEHEVASAVGEAFNNVAVHGFVGIAPGAVQIEVDWDDEKLAVTMIDSGHTYDRQAVVMPDLDALPESGMGIFIMNSCMDEVDYRAGPPNVLRLVKFRRRDGAQPRASLPGSAQADVDPEILGDRPSGVDVIEAGDTLDTPSVSNWRMKAVGAGEKTGESSRRK